MLSDHGVDLRGIARVEVVTQGAQFTLLGFDLGQAGGIGVYSIQRLGRRFGPVGQKCAQNVLGDFVTDAVGEVSSAIPASGTINQSPKST